MDLGKAGQTRISWILVQNPRFSYFWIFGFSGSGPPARARVARAGPVGENIQKPLIFLMRKRRFRSVRSKCRKRRPEIIHMRRKTKDLVLDPPPGDGGGGDDDDAGDRRSLLRGPGPVQSPHHPAPRGFHNPVRGSLTPMWGISPPRPLSHQEPVDHPFGLLV